MRKILSHETCIKTDYSGKIILRFEDKDVHKEVAKLAKKKSMSINLLLNIMIKDGLRKESRRLARSQKYESLMEE